MCLHRPGTAASQWGEAGEDGPGAGDVQTGAAATGAAAPGTGGRTQPAAAQQRYGWVCVCVCVLVALFQTLLHDTLFKYSQ